jgi:hypothetical protein
MKPLDTRRIFREHLADQSLDPDQLDPWSGWQAFKQFLKKEVDSSYDAAAVQFGIGDDGGAMFYVRQFTERENNRPEAEDVLKGRLIVEFDYDLPAVEGEIWTLDYRTLEEWAAVVEGDTRFQSFVNHVPTYTDVYFDSGSG